MTTIQIEQHRSAIKRGAPESFPCPRCGANGKTILLDIAFGGDFVGSEFYIDCPTHGEVECSKDYRKRRTRKMK